MEIARQSNTLLCQHVVLNYCLYALLVQSVRRIKTQRTVTILSLKIMSPVPSEAPVPSEECYKHLDEQSLGMSMRFLYLIITRNGFGVKFVIRIGQIC